MIEVHVTCGTNVCWYHELGRRCTARLEQIMPPPPRPRVEASAREKVKRRLTQDRTCAEMHQR